LAAWRWRKIFRWSTLDQNKGLPFRLSRVYRINLRRNAIIISAVLLVFGLLVTLIGATLVVRSVADTDNPPVYVGIDVAFDDEEAVYKIADAVKGYVNLIVLGSLNVTTDTAKLTRVCDHLYQRDFSFIVFVAFTVEATQPPYLPPDGPSAQFFLDGMKRWGDKLLGAYVFDEAGGKYIDLTTKADLPYVTNYSEAAETFVTHTGYILKNYSDYYGDPSLKRYTSDYALYWYDYLTGYDVVFGEFVGNQSRQLSVALCRGAAKSLSKSWGTIITWKYDQPPFIEEPVQLFLDMVLAYRNGAKYIIVFNSPANHTATTEYGILTQTHLNVIKAFWYYTKLWPPTEEFPAETAYVLPSDYGYGFRGPDDKIWGIFGPDSLSPVIWNATNSLIQKYGTRLDIVYETKTDNVPITLPYTKLIYWNGTTIEK
jgi:hypothetical protein